MLFMEMMYGFIDTDIEHPEAKEEVDVSRTPDSQIAAAARAEQQYETTDRVVASIHSSYRYEWVAVT